MLTIDLSTLSAPELKRLMEAARARGQDALAERLASQLAAGAPRVGSVRPMHLPPPDPIWTEPQASAPDRRGGRPWARGGLLAAAAGVATIALALDLPSAPIPQAAPTPRLQLAHAGPIVTPLVTTEATSPLTAAAAVTAARAAAPAPAASKPNPCRDEPTPADRLVCGYPVLAQHDRALQAALQRAVAAGVDVQAVQRDQAAWKAERDGVSDWQRLAELYRGRLQEVEAAAAAAETLAAP